MKRNTLALDARDHRRAAGQPPHASPRSNLAAAPPRGRPPSHVQRYAGVGVLCLPFALGCAHLTPSQFASVRIGAYLAAHRETPAAIAGAMEAGHVVLGMDQRQVWVVLGDPVRRTTFGAGSSVNLWLYPGYRLHQDQMHGHGAALFRLVFIDGRLALIEPI